MLRYFGVNVIPTLPSPGRRGSAGCPEEGNPRTARRYYLLRHAADRASPTRGQSPDTEQAQDLEEAEATATAAATATPRRRSSDSTR